MIFKKNEFISIFFAVLVINCEKKTLKIQAKKLDSSKLCSTYSTKRCQNSKIAKKRNFSATLVLLSYSRFFQETLNTM